MAEEETTTPADGGPAQADEQSLDPVALKKERDDYYDRYLRQAAEFDNYRKRVDRERRARGDEAVERLMLDVLSVVDDFDRALAMAADDSSGSYRKGVEMIHAKLNETLKRHGVKPIDTLGASFDPNLHQAVAYEESADHGDGQIVSEMQKGYTINDRLLRPAMVKVAKA